MALTNAICVYCASSNDVAPVYNETARDMGTILGQANKRLVFGGGKVGMMGITADACMAAGGAVTGIIPRHLHDIEVGHDDLTELHVVDSMHIRKRMMFDLSDAFVALPGGFGTMDEFFEILTWRQIRLHDKPVVMVNTNGMYDQLLAFMDFQVEEKFARPGHRDHFHVVSAPEEVLPLLDSLPEPEFTAAPELM